MLAWRYEISLLVLKKIFHSFALLTREIFFNTRREISYLYMPNEMNQDYKIRSLGLKRVREMNNVSYYLYSLSVQAQGADLTF